MLGCVSYTGEYGGSCRIDDVALVSLSCGSLARISRIALTVWDAASHGVGRRLSVRLHSPRFPWEPPRVCPRTRASRQDGASSSNPNFLRLPARFSLERVELPDCPFIPCGSVWIRRTIHRIAKHFNGHWCCSIYEPKFVNPWFTPPGGKNWKIMCISSVLNLITSNTSESKRAYFI